jgi:N-acetylmuramoyl-L-alanine amidase
MAWYPSADKTVKGNSAGSYTGGPFKGVLHTTEGSSGSGAIGAYKANNSWPHFQVDPNGKVWQFVDTNVSARALKNLSGGVQTNTDSVIQIEIVGFAGKPNEHSPAQIDALKALMRWIEANTGVKPKGPGKPFATAYGQNNLRFSNSEWDAFDGWCGHCHVPENDHWDPGAINLGSLLPPPGPSIPASYFTEAFVPFTLIRPQGGYLVVGGDGGIFTYDGAPFHGSLPGIGVTDKIISAAWSPTGNGYWLLGDEGEVYGFGDADYSGGFNTLPPAVKGNRKPIGIVAKGNGYRIVTIDPSQDGSPFDPYDFGV